MSAVQKRNTFFGPSLDALLREVGGWPEDVVAYKATWINSTQTLMTGEVPVGHRRDGRPRFGGRRSSKIFQATISDKQYHECISKDIAAKAEASS